MLVLFLPAIAAFLQSFTRRLRDECPKGARIMKWVGVLHLVGVACAVVLMVHTHITRTPEKFIVQWQSASLASMKFNQLIMQEPQSLPAYRYILEHARSSIARRAKERINLIENSKELYTVKENYESLEKANPMEDIQIRKVEFLSDTGPVIGQPSNLSLNYKLYLEGQLPQPVFKVKEGYLLRALSPEGEDMVLKDRSKRWKLTSVRLQPDKRTVLFQVFITLPTPSKIPIKEMSGFLTCLIDSAGSDQGTKEIHIPFSLTNIPLS